MIPAQGLHHLPKSLKDLEQIKNWKLKNWKGVKNIDLWQLLDEATTKQQITWHWVRGHDGNAGNERADFLANLAITELQKV